MCAHAYIEYINSLPQCMLKVALLLLELFGYIICSCSDNDDKSFNQAEDLALQITTLRKVITMIYFVSAPTCNVM